MCRPLRGVSVFCLRGRMWCWRWFGWRWMSNFQIIPALYPGSKAMDPRPYASLDNMWRVFSDLAHNKTSAVNGETFFPLPVSSTGARSSAPSGPRPTDHGRGQGRVPSQSLSWQTESSHHPTVMAIGDSSDPWLDHTSNCWPLEEHHYADVFAVSASFKRDYPLPFGAASFHPPLARMPSETIGGFASTATKTTAPSSIVGILSIMPAAV